jgi:hypothetical protein
MPCKDTSSKISVKIDSNDCLLDFDFSKLTCQKEIGGGNGFKEFCAGRTIDSLLDIEFVQVLDALKIEGSEEEFLLYLEWDALRASIAQYLGATEKIDQERYKIDSIIHDDGFVEIQQYIYPPSEMPKIVSCHVRERNNPE